jgi:hypothetical protein
MSLGKISKGAPTLTNVAASIEKYVKDTPGMKKVTRPSPNILSYYSTGNSKQGVCLELKTGRKITSSTARRVEALVSQLSSRVRADCRLTKWHNYVGEYKVDCYAGRADQQLGPIATVREVKKVRKNIPGMSKIVKANVTLGGLCWLEKDTVNGIAIGLYAKGSMTPNKMEKIEELASNLSREFPMSCKFTGPSSFVVNKYNVECHLEKGAVYAYNNLFDLLP